MNNSSEYLVILAGGRGERLWPLSRKNRPKQLLPFGDNEKSLLEQTINRVSSLVPQENIWIITTDEQREYINTLLKSRVGRIISEPVSRNTAPAVLLSSLLICQEDPCARIAFLPADHCISEEGIFRNSLKNLLQEVLDKQYITLLGVNPRWPAMGYGYIECKDIHDESLQKVIHFHEKPSKEIANLYISLGTMLWNIGIFCAQAQVFIEEYKKNAPELFNYVDGYQIGTHSYDECPSISFDHAILEKSSRVYVLPVSFSWSDVGNLDTFLTLQEKKSNTANIMQINAHENVVHASEKLIVLIDVEKLCIVETKDVLLIAQREQTDKVKQILTQLRVHNEEQYL